MDKETTVPARVTGQVKTVDRHGFDAFMEGTGGTRYSVEFPMSAVEAEQRRFLRQGARFQVTDGRTCFVLDDEIVEVARGESTRDWYAYMS